MVDYWVGLLDGKMDDLRVVETVEKLDVLTVAYLVDWMAV